MIFYSKMYPGNALSFFENSSHLLPHLPLLLCGVYKISDSNISTKLLQFKEGG